MLPAADFFGGQHPAHARQMISRRLQIIGNSKPVYQISLALSTTTLFFAGIVWIACVLVANSGPSGMSCEHLHAAQARHEQEGACEPHAAK